MLQPKKDAPHQVTKSGESHQRYGQEEQVAGLGFNLASLLEYPAMQEFVKAAAAARGIDHAFKSIQPNRRLQLDLTQDRFETLRNISDIDIIVVQPRRRDLAEVLHQQKVDLVAGRTIFGRLGKEMLQQGEHALLIPQCAGLKELA